jgi:hypothetical protein
MKNINEKEVVCKNCSTIFTGNYCNNCGQDAITNRITWSYLAHLLPHALFHVDGGIFYTLKELFVRPGPSIREYFEGKRTYHFNPFMYMIITGGLYILLLSKIGLSLVYKEVSLENVEHFNNLLGHKYFMIPGLFALILLSVTDYFLYKKHKYNLAELFIFNSFCMGQTFVIVLLFIPILYLQKYLDVEYGFHIIVRPLIKLSIVFYLLYAHISLFFKKGDYFVLLIIIAQIVLILNLYDFFIIKFAELF